MRERDRGGYEETRLEEFDALELIQVPVQNRTLRQFRMNTNKGRNEAKTV